MTDDRFWELVALGTADRAAFRAALAAASERDLVEFYWEHKDREAQLVEQVLADHMEEPTSDDSLRGTVRRVYDDRFGVPLRYADEPPPA